MDEEVEQDDHGNEENEQEKEEEEEEKELCVCVCVCVCAHALTHVSYGLLQLVPQQRNCDK